MIAAFIHFFFSQLVWLLGSWRKLLSNTAAAAMVVMFIATTSACDQAKEREITSARRVLATGVRVYDDWVTISGGSLRNSNIWFHVGDECVVEKWGTLEAVDEVGDNYIVRYTPPGGKYGGGTQCPLGVYYIESKQKFAKETGETLADAKKKVTRVLNQGGRNLPPPILNYKFEYCTVQNVDGVQNANRITEFGGSCTLAFGVKLTPVGEDDNRYLIRYDLDSDQVYSGHCPGGTLFYVNKDEYAEAGRAPSEE